MIEIIENLGTDTLGFEAIGNISGEDYETILIPLVEEKLRQYEKINLLYHIGTRFKSFDMKAMWDDAKIGFSHITSWKKIAVVTDIEWIASAVKVFAFIIPASVMVFPNAELEDAKAWLKNDL